MWDISLINEVTVDAQTNLSDLPFSAQKQLMPAAMLSSLQYVSQTFESDWSLELAFKPAKEATRVQAAVDDEGMYETTRNKTLLSKPDFVTDNESKQIERLKKEIETSRQQKKQLAQFGVNAPEGRINLAALPQSSANELLVQSREQNADVDMLVNQLSIDNTARIDLNISQVQGRLEGLYDNRAQRHFKGQKMTQMRQEVDNMDKLGTTDLKENARSRRASQAARPQQRGDLYMGEDYGGRARSGQAGSSTAGGLLVQYDADTNATAGADAGGEGYVAGGVYSLPVSLPGGGVRLDFARPSGDAELTIWAVPDRAVAGTLNTLVVLVISIVVTMAIRIWPRNLKPAAFKIRYAIVYAVLVVGLTIIFGIAGLIAAAMIVTITELSRAKLAR